MLGLRRPGQRVRMLENRGTANRKYATATPANIAECAWPTCLGFSSTKTEPNTSGTSKRNRLTKFKMRHASSVELAVTGELALNGFIL